MRVWGSWCVDGQQTARLLSPALSLSHRITTDTGRLATDKPANLALMGWSPTQGSLQPDFNPLYRRLRTSCSNINLFKVQWSLYVPHSGHYMYHQFNIHKLYVLPTQLYLCVLCGSQNKQRLLPYTTMNDWFYVLPTRLYLCVLCGSENKQRLLPYTTMNDWFYVLPTHCIYVFCVDLTTNSDYFPTQQWMSGFYNRDLTL